MNSTAAEEVITDKEPLLAPAYSKLIFNIEVVNLVIFVVMFVYPVFRRPLLERKVSNGEEVLLSRLVCEFH